MKQINFESDFKIHELFADRRPLTEAPFRFTYYTKVSRGTHVAEFDGARYINCLPTADGGVIVPFDHPQLGTGVLMVKREFFLTDSDFKDGICNLVSIENTGIIIDRGVTQDYGEIDVTIFPYYQKGDTGKSAYQEWIDLGNEGSVQDFIASLKGEPFTYEDLTDEQKRELSSYVPTYASEEITDITTIL